MSVLPGLIDHAEVSLVTATTALAAKILPALMAAGLGALLLYGAAFSTMSALHNAAHDSRHSASFPCH